MCKDTSPEAISTSSCFGSTDVATTQDGQTPNLCSCRQSKAVSSNTLVFAPGSRTVCLLRSALNHPIRAARIKPAYLTSNAWAGNPPTTAAGSRLAAHALECISGSSCSARRSAAIANTLPGIPAPAHTTHASSS
eukprot:1197324-Rhodomonas_salina.1